MKSLSLHITESFVAESTDSFDINMSNAKWVYSSNRFNYKNVLFSINGDNLQCLMKFDSYDSAKQFSESKLMQTIDAFSHHILSQYKAHNSPRSFGYGAPVINVDIVSDNAIMSIGFNESKHNNSNSRTKESIKCIGSLKTGKIDTNQASFIKSLKDYANDIKEYGFVGTYQRYSCSLFASMKFASEYLGIDTKKFKLSEDMFDDDFQRSDWQKWSVDLLSKI